MDYYLGEDSDGEMIWKQDKILSTDLKKMAGFGKGGLKNYPGIITGLQMQLYLVITDFQRRKNKNGNEYGMNVSVMFPPEKIWEYDFVTSAFDLCIMRQKVAENISISEKETETKMNIEVNGHLFTATLADNSSAKALAELIKSEPLTIEMNDYGDFEKVGRLPQSLPKSDEYISTEV